MCKYFHLQASSGSSIPREKGVHTPWVCSISREKGEHTPWHCSGPREKGVHIYHEVVLSHVRINYRPPPSPTPHPPPASGNNLHRLPVSSDPPRFPSPPPPPPPPPPTHPPPGPAPPPTNANNLHRLPVSTNGNNLHHLGAVNSLDARARDTITSCCEGIIWVTQVCLLVAVTRQSVLRWTVMIRGSWLLLVKRALYEWWW